MSETQESSLLWINKDASNVHRRKHLSEANAHVQKSGMKKSRPGKLSSHKKRTFPLRELSEVEDQPLTPGFPSAFPNEGVTRNILNLRHHDEIANSSTYEPDRVVASRSLPSKERPTAALIFSSYLEDRASSAPDADTSELCDLLPESQLTEPNYTEPSSLPVSLDASSPIPGFFTDLSSHDRMLVHTHLTYMPQMYYGLSNQATYCPIRTASVANMIKAPVGVLWVLISLDMYMETVRKSCARKNAILRRKNYAYRLMTKAFNDNSASEDPAILLGPAAAAIAEMFCGDPVRALVHLNGINTFIEARGGLDYVKDMELTISMPVFAVSAYRTLLQDSLTNTASFERARASFMTTMRSILKWNNEIMNISTLPSPITHNTTPQREDTTNNDHNLRAATLTFQTTRERAFMHSPLLHRFVGATYETNKPGERVDHFIILYNLNRMLADHGRNITQATDLVENILTDVETSGSTRAHDSSIKITGVLRLVTNRQAKMYPDHPSAGVARAWEALDALEIMKFFSPRTRESVFLTLHSLLCGKVAGAMTPVDLDDLDSELQVQWRTRCMKLSVKPG